MTLGVAQLESGVAEAFCSSDSSRAFDHLRGDVDPDRASAIGEPCGITCRLTGPTPDIENTVGRTDAISALEQRVVELQLLVVVKLRAGLS